MRAVDAFLSGILDYAGLFPPAALDLDSALKAYREYREHPRAGLLARFVLPAHLLEASGLPDRLTVTIVGPPLPALPPSVESIETQTIFVAPTDVRVFYELDWRGNFEAGMTRLAGRAGAAVKLRMGGEAIPPPDAVTRFLKGAASHKLPIKFTAGLHSAFSHDGGYGFVNLFCAAFAAYTPSDPVASFLARPASDFRFDNDALQIAGHEFSADAIENLRRNWVISFGSCSFLEPVESLEHAGL
jgi:hypothetical protein